MGLGIPITRKGWWVLVLVACMAAPLNAAKPRSGPVPDTTIPIEPLGYRPPGQLYLLARFSTSSLTFLDSTHVLLTFHLSKLLERDQHEPGHETGNDQFVRALVLELPSGKVTASADWRMHDRRRYLWPLGNGRVLVRQMDRFSVTDATLRLRPLLVSPTPLQETYVSPDGRMLVMESEEEQHTPEEHAKLVDKAHMYGEDSVPESVHIRMVRLDQKTLMLNARAEQPGKLIANEDGYVSQAQEQGGLQWTIRFHPFEKPEPNGGDVVAQFASTCAPESNFLNASTILVMSCLKDAPDRFAQAFSIDGKHLWVGKWRSNFVWPVLRVAGDGNTFAIAWISTSRPMEPYDPVSDTEVEAQVVDVIDAKTGALRFHVEVQPILSAGGNFALSPDGDKLAVVNRGALEVYTVPPTAPAPVASSSPRPR